MRRTVRFPIVVATVIATLLSVTTASALAQGVAQARAGAEVTVTNNGECRPNTDVALFFEGAGVAEVRVGSAVSDAAGSFVASVIVPAEATPGAAAILADCGLDSAVLAYDIEVVGAGFSLGSLVGPVLVGLAVIAIIGLVAMLRRRRNAGDGADDSAGDDAGVADGDTVEAAPASSDAQPMAMPVAVGAPVPDPGAGHGGAPAFVAPGAASAGVAAAPAAATPAPAMAAPLAPVPAQAAAADADHDDGGIDDGADYWFWEAATSAGPRRRVACMTETTFHLHEVSVEAFQPMLDRLVEVGPDEALAQAFVRIPVAAVDRVVREGTVVHIEGRSANGPRRQTIDLADGADGVVEMLARRLPVVDAARMQESVR
ncbi:MAG: hypothetical protein ACE367_17080 [Acidimicrobiales bacterium]